jgi:hypothetical protein
MTNTTIRVAAIMFATLTLGSEALSQRSTEPAAFRDDTRKPAASDRMKGFMLGVYTVGAPGITLTGDDIDGTFATTFGPGAGATIGFGVTNRLSAYASFDIAKQKTAPDDTPDGSWGLAHFEVGGRASLPLGTSSTIPYVTAGWGRRALAARLVDEDGDGVDVSFSGSMIAVGGGVEHFISPTLAIDAGVGLAFGTLSDYEEGGDKVDFQLDRTRSMRLRIGMTWRPGARSN